MGFTEHNDRRALVELTYHCLAFVVGADASREEAEAGFATSPKFRVGLSNEVRNLVLDRFEPDRDPVAGRDFLPQPVSDARVQEITDELNQFAAGGVHAEGWALMQPEVAHTRGFLAPGVREVELRDGTVIVWSPDIRRWELAAQAVA
jgi:hypothetical protein